MLDEFGLLGRFEVFAEAMSHMAGFGLRACLAVQSFNQIYKSYGRHETITSNCDTTVRFTPNDLGTAEEISRLIGQTNVRHEHRTQTGGGGSVSEPEVGRAADDGGRGAADERGGSPDIRARAKADPRTAAQVSRAALLQTAGGNCTTRSIATARLPRRPPLACGKKKQGDQPPVQCRGEAASNEVNGRRACRPTMFRGGRFRCRAAVKFLNFAAGNAAAKDPGAIGRRRSGMRPRLVVYVTAEELAQMRREAARRRLSLSRYAKERLAPAQDQFE